MGVESKCSRPMLVLKMKETNQKEGNLVCWRIASWPVQRLFWKDSQLVKGNIQFESQPYSLSTQKWVHHSAGLCFGFLTTSILYSRQLS